jgi:Domain of unknown function (DUF4214)
MPFFSHFFRRRVTSRYQAGSPARAAARLTVEILEDRTVPSSAKVIPFTQVADGVSTFYRLADALKVATTSGDVVTILPGSTADAGPVSVSANGITIQGDANVPAAILPVYSINVVASNVTLKRLNLNNVTFVAGTFNGSVVLSLVNTISITGDASGSGGNIIDQDQIARSVTLTGAGAGTPALNNVITNNNFNSLVNATPIVAATDNSNLTIQNNTITGGGPKAQVGIQVTRGAGNVIANNTVDLFGADNTTWAIEVDDNGGAQASDTVRNNVVSTGAGVGLFINAFNDVAMAALVQGNDFHGNAVGVDYLGAGGAIISSNLGGSVNGVGQFIGANNFRGYPAVGTSGSASIRLRNVGAAATLSAQFNIFDPNNPAATTFVLGGLGTVDTTQNLSSQRAFVETLFNSLLGRAGQLSELDTWVNTLTTQGQAAVANGILRSNASLSRIVDSYYLKYLGRVADAPGEQFWVAQIQGGSSLESIQAGFISSAEFRAKNDSDYVQGLYRTFLGRTGSAAELAFWYTQLQTPNGLNTTALGFANSAENRGTFVQSLFTTYLHRTASSQEQASLAGQAGDLLTLQASVLSTAEYFTNG